MKFSYDSVRGHYRLTDYTPGMGSRVIDTDLDLGALMARHFEPEEPAVAPTVNDEEDLEDPFSDLLD